MRALLDGEREQKPFDRDEAVARLLRRLLGRGEDLGQRLRHIELAVAARDLRQLAERRLDAEPGIPGAAAGALDQRRAHALLVVEKHLQEVFGRELLMPFRQGIGLRGLKKAAHAFGVFFGIHSRWLHVMSRPSWRETVFHELTSVIGRPVLKAIWEAETGCGRGRPAIRPPCPSNSKARLACKPGRVFSTRSGRAR